VQLEKEAKEVEQFYQSTDDQKNDCKKKGMKNTPTGSKKPLQRASKKNCEASASTSAIYCLVILLLFDYLIILEEWTFKG